MEREQAMRVISGTARGRKLLSPQGNDTRPTTDRIKETLFNIISPLVPDSVFLDIFGGSGAIGIEALSRGAELAVFVDNSRKAVNLIRENLKLTNLSEKSLVLEADYKKAMQLLSEQNRKFHVIFMDPPYYKDFTLEALELTVKYNLLANEGIIVTELGSKEPLPEVSGLKVYRQKNFGTTTMVFMCGENQ